MARLANGVYLGKTHYDFVVEEPSESHLAGVWQPTRDDRDVKADTGHC